MELYDKDGTIASVLKARMGEIFTDNNIKNIRRRVIDIVSNDYRIDNNPAKQEAIDIFTKCRDNALISTITTYITGVKVGD